jgi:hypothetical protein
LLKGVEQSKSVANNHHHQLLPPLAGDILSPAETVSTAKNSLGQKISVKKQNATPLKARADRHQQWQ